MNYELVGVSHERAGRAFETEETLLAKSGGRSLDRIYSIEVTSMA
jgi:hypothetical protein